MRQLIVEFIFDSENEDKLNELVQFLETIRREGSNEQEGHLSDERMGAHKKAIDDAHSGNHERYKKWEEVKTKYEEWL